MAETDRSIDRSYLDNRSVSRLSGRAWKNKFSKVSYVATFTYVRPRIFIFNRVKSSKDGERERETAEERERRDGFGVFKDGGALFTAVSSAGIRGYFGASLPEPRRGGREREKEGSGRRLPHHHQAAVKLCAARTPLEPRRRKRVRPLVHTAVRRSVCCWWLHQLSALVGCNYPGRAATRRRRRRAERERESERAGEEEGEGLRTQDMDLTARLSVPLSRAFFVYSTPRPYLSLHGPRRSSSLPLPYSFPITVPPRSFLLPAPRFGEKHSLSRLLTSVNVTAGHVGVSWPRIRAPPG